MAAVRFEQKKRIEEKKKLRVAMQTTTYDVHDYL